MTQPFFSVIVPTYNRASFLPRCIQSVQGQRFSEWELLVVDDGSTDNTETVVAPFVAADARIRFLRQKNKGVSAARNLGLRHASGKFLCFLDSDDAFHANHLQLFHEEIRRRGFGSVFLSTGFHYAEGNELRSTHFSPPAKRYPQKDIERIMSAFLPYSPCVQTICIPAFVKEKVAFNEQLRLSECYDFCAKTAALVEEVVYLPEATVTLYGHTSNASVPTNTEETIQFNSDQFEEFLLMRKDPFYRRIVRTPAFRKRLFYLQFELVKTAFRKRTPGALVRSLAKAMYYNPTYVFKVNYWNVAKKIANKFNNRGTAGNR